MDNNYFSTTDLGLATFLDMSGIDLREVVPSYPNSNQFAFEFRIAPDAEELTALISEWNRSERAKDLKRFAYSNKKLRAIIRQKLIDNKTQCGDN